MKLAIDLSRDAVADLVRQFVSGADDDQIGFVLRAIVDENFHSRDHIETVRRFAAIVSNRCNIKLEVKL